MSFNAASTVGSPNPTTVVGLWGAGGGGVLPSIIYIQSKHNDYNMS